MAYRGQLDHLVRAEDRGRAVLNTRTIAVFDDGLVVCAVSVYDDAAKPAGIVSGLRRAGRPRRSAEPGRGDERVRAEAEATGSCVTFAGSWPRARLIPLPVVERIVLRRPRQVSELAIYEAGTELEPSVYLGDLSVERVRQVLGPVVGARLQIEIAE
jgi:hypothetical protein